MNYRILREIMTTDKLKQGDHSAVSILTVLALHANEDGIAWPGFDTIVQESRLSRGTVSQTLKLLENALYITRETGNGRGHQTAYKFHLSQAIALSEYKESVQSVNSLKCSVSEQINEQFSDKNCSFSEGETVHFQTPHKENSTYGRNKSTTNYSSSGGGESTRERTREAPPPPQKVHPLFRNLDAIGAKVVELWGVNEHTPKPMDVQHFPRAMQVFRKANAPPDEIERYYFGFYGPGRKPPNLSQVPETFNQWIARNQPELKEHRNGTHRQHHTKGYEPATNRRARERDELRRELFSE